MIEIVLDIEEIMYEVRQALQEAQDSDVANALGRALDYLGLATGAVLTADKLSRPYNLSTDSEKEDSP